MVTHYGRSRAVKFIGEINVNTETRNGFASSGLELLKYAVLHVLYLQHLWTVDAVIDSENFPQPYLRLRQIREELGLPHVGVNNDLVKGVLNYLKEDGYVDSYTGDLWKISEEGVEFIKGVA